MGATEVQTAQAPAPSDAVASAVLHGVEPTVVCPLASGASAIGWVIGAGCAETCTSGSRRARGCDFPAPLTSSLVSSTRTMRSGSTRELRERAKEVQPGISEEKTRLIEFRAICRNQSRSTAEQRNPRHLVFWVCSHLPDRHGREKFCVRRKTLAKKVAAICDNLEDIIIGRISLILN